MFGLSWSEIIIIAVVALIVVGPKDLPRAMRTAARWVRAGQKLAREFQGHVDELVREAELDELRDKVQKAASEPLSSHVGSFLDPGGELAEALKPPDPLTEPIVAAPQAAAVEAVPAPAIPELPSAVTEEVAVSKSETPIPEAPIPETAAQRHDG